MGVVSGGFFQPQQWQIYLPAYPRSICIRGPLSIWAKVAKATRTAKVLWFQLWFGIFGCTIPDLQQCGVETFQTHREQSGNLWHKCILIARLQVKYVNLNTPFYLITVIALLPYYPLLPYYHLRYRIYCTVIYFTAARSLTCCLLSSETLDRTQLKELDSCVCNVSAPTDIDLKRESFPSTIRQIQTDRSGLRRVLVNCNTRLFT